MDLTPSHPSPFDQPSTPRKSSTTPSHAGRTAARSHAALPQGDELVATRTGCEEMASHLRDRIGLSPVRGCHLGRSATDLLDALGYSRSSRLDHKSVAWGDHGSTRSAARDRTAALGAKPEFWLDPTGSSAGKRHGVSGCTACQKSPQSRAQHCGHWGWDRPINVAKWTEALQQPHHCDRDRCR